MSGHAEVFHVGEHLKDELAARGWTPRDLAERMEGLADVNECAVQLIIFLRDPNLMLGAKMAEAIGKALGTSAEIWMNLDRVWRERQGPEGRA